jgi:hypothetical protein
LERKAKCIRGTNTGCEGGFQNEQSRHYCDRWLGRRQRPPEAILGRLPAELPAAVFAVLHIPAQGIGILSTVASSASALAVRQAETGMKVEPGRVYLWAPDHHLLLSGDNILLGRGPPENMVGPARCSARA